MQMVTWLVAGCAWALWLLLVDDMRRGVRTGEVALWFIVTSGVAVAATATALGGR